MNYALIGYSYNKGDTTFGFGRCFVEALSSLPMLEASLCREHGFTHVSVISLAKLSKTDYMKFKRRKFL